MKKFCLYLKFYHHLISTIDRWHDLLINIDYDKTDVYIWIYDKDSSNIFANDNIINYKNKYNRCIFISNCNEINYLDDNDILYLNQFKRANLITVMCSHAESHLKSFLIPKNVEYIFNLDADDMFYPTLKVEHLTKIVQYMDNDKEVNILTRPYWIWTNCGWSFGFTIARKSILDYLDLFNNFKNTTEWNRNGALADSNRSDNLDNLFGQILEKYNISPSKLFFYIEDNKWEKAGEMDYLYKHNCIKI